MGTERMAQSQHWRKKNTSRLAGLANTLRDDLWKAVGLSGPMTRAELLPWLLERAAPDVQKRAGDRCRLYLSRDIAAPEYDRHFDANVPELLRLLSARDERYLPVRRERSRYYMDTFTGRYTDKAPGEWPGFCIRPKVQPLALVALAAGVVHGMTGATIEEAVEFLMCDIPCGRPFRLNTSVPAGVTVWCYDDLVSGEALGREFVAARQQLFQVKRSKRPEAHTRELIELVREMRPVKGRHKSNASWSEVLERWNATHERKRYADEASIQRAWAQTRKRRARLGALGDAEREDDEA